MKIVSSEYVISAVGPKHYPQGNLPEIAFVGRSNVGKSSLINTLLNRRELARTSQKPGKTQAINFFLINKEFYFVDLPGYGFAKVPKSVKEQWGRMIEGYLKKRENLKAVILLIDLRHPPTGDDVLMYDWLKHFNIPTIIAATKADKISRGQWQAHKKTIKEKLQSGDDPIITFSSQTGQGKDEMWDAICDKIDLCSEVQNPV